jgi:hypothetical protein
VCAELGLRAGGYDVNAACCGFVYALHGATALLADSLSTVLVIGADRFTTLTDPSDRGTAVLFGDGAGALVVRRAERRPGAPGVLGSDVGGDPRTLGVIEQPPGERYLPMDGPACSPGHPGHGGLGRHPLRRGGTGRRRPVRLPGQRPHHPGGGRPTGVDGAWRWT